MKWKWFWISLAVLLGSLKVKNIADFVDIPLISPLKEIAFILLFCSFIFCVYFILDKTGAIEYLTQNQEED